MHQNKGENMLEGLSPLVQCLLGVSFCFICTTLGASMVFLIKGNNPKKLYVLLSLAGGIMIASSFFSLLNPAIEACEEQNLPVYIFVALGFLIGGLFIVLSDKILDKFFSMEKYSKHKNFKKSIIFAGSITFHNIPEGIAVGIAFGSIAINADPTMIMSAFALAFGIGIQNIPEGVAVALPLKVQGVSTKKCFFVGLLSGIVEPIFAIMAFLLCFFVSSVLPFLLSFAAGAMVAVATCELIPESVAHNKNKSTLFMILGFVIMAVLDTAFA